jgi:hypothetical protein
MTPKLPTFGATAVFPPVTFEASRRFTAHRLLSLFYTHLAPPLFTLIKNVQVRTSILRFLISCIICLYLLTLISL